MTDRVDGRTGIRIDPNAEGCGFWLPIDGATIEARPEEWWACAIPDAEHHDRDHVLIRRRRGDRVGGRSVPFAADLGPLAQVGEQRR